MGKIPLESMSREGLENLIAQTEPDVPQEVLREYARRGVVPEGSGGAFRLDPIGVDTVAPGALIPTTPDDSTPSLVFHQVARLLDQLQCYKEMTYKGSWCRRGDVGIAHNVFRKVDRIDNLIKAAAAGYDLDAAKLPPADAPENLSITIADAAVYLILWLARRRYTNPQEYAVIEKEVERLEQAHAANKEYPIKSG